MMQFAFVYPHLTYGTEIYGNTYFSVIMLNKDMQMKSINERK